MIENPFKLPDAAACDYHAATGYEPGCGDCAHLQPARAPVRSEPCQGCAEPWYACECAFHERSPS